MLVLTLLSPGPVGPKTCPGIVMALAVEKHYNARRSVFYDEPRERIDSLRSPIGERNALQKDRRAQQVDRVTGEIMT